MIVTTCLLVAAMREAAQESLNVPAPLLIKGNVCAEVGWNP